MSPASATCSATRRPGTLGVPFPNTEMRVVDIDDHTRDVTADEVGVGPLGVRVGEHRGLLVLRPDVANLYIPAADLLEAGLSAGIVDAGVSRGLAGISGSTLVVNIPGSRGAVRDGMATLGPLASQVIAQLSRLDI